MISGLSGAAVHIGPVQLKGMGLATVVAILSSLAFLIFRKKLGLSNEKVIGIGIERNGKL